MKLLTLLLLIALYGCGGGTTTGNPVSEVNIVMKDRSAVAWWKKSSNLLIPEAMAATSDIRFCFKRLRFKMETSSPDDNIDLNIGEKEILPTGTDITNVTIPHGTYRRVEFDLDKDCDGTPKPSVSFSNPALRSSQSHITIKFEGTFVLDGNTTLDLNIQPLILAMDGVTDNDQIKDALENALGDF